MLRANNWSICAGKSSFDSTVPPLSLHCPPPSRVRYQCYYMLLHATTCYGRVALPRVGPRMLGFCSKPDYSPLFSSYSPPLGQSPFTTFATSTPSQMISPCYIANVGQSAITSRSILRTEPDYGSGEIVGPDGYTEYGGMHCTPYLHLPRRVLVPTTEGLAGPSNGCSHMQHSPRLPLLCSFRHRRMENNTCRRTTVVAPRTTPYSG